MLNKNNPLILILIPRIPSNTFKYWANEIVKNFPTENCEIYFIPYQKDFQGRPISAKGKLWDKYINKRRLYRKIGILDNKPNKGNLFF